MKATSVFNFAIYVLAVLLISSCSTSSKYGNRSDKYSRARAKSNNHRPYDSKSDSYVDVKKPKSQKETTPSSNQSSSKDKSLLKNTEYKKRDDMIYSAKQYMGIPYKSAGKSPIEGFDCSGFANYVYNQNGFAINGPSYDLAKMGIHRDQIDLKPGDLVFFGVDNKINHVGIVTQNDSKETHFIHSSSSEGIKIDVINASEYWSKRYLFGRDLLYELMMGKYFAAKP